MYFNFRRRPSLRNTPNFLAIMLSIVGLCHSPTLAMAKLKIITTTTNLAWLVKEIAGDHADVEALLNGTEDPHYIDAKPSFILKVANADVVCSVGLSLEVGWLPKVLMKSGNRNVQKGGAGYCVLGEAVSSMEVPTGVVDRSQGDVHPEGNPHFSISPLRMLEAADAAYKVLVKIDTTNQQVYQARLISAKKKLKSIQQQGREKLAGAGILTADHGRVSESGAKGTKGAKKTKKPEATTGRTLKTMQYHKEFTYFLHDYGIRSVGTLEAIPGSPPSAGQLAKAAQLAKAENVTMVLATTYNNRNITQRFSTLTGIPTVTVPLHLRPSAGLADYEKLQFLLLDTIVKAWKTGEKQDAATSK